MNAGMIRTGLLAALVWLLAALVPGGAALAQVTCPSAANDETLNIVTSGGVTTCTNIGTAAATQGIEIRNNLVEDIEPYGAGAGGSRFGIAFRRITAGGNEQPTGTGCVGHCFSQSDPNVVADVEYPLSSSVGQAHDWGYGVGTVTMVQCGSGLNSSYSCTVSFQFADGIQGSFSMTAGSTVIPSFSLGGTLSFAPTVTSVSPDRGLAAGGTTVTIRGANFDTATNVHFSEIGFSNGMVSAGTPAASFQIISSTEIRAVTPALPYSVAMAHFTPVSVTNTTGKGFLASAFAYLPASLTITTMSLPAASIGTSYNTTLAASGGTPSILDNFGLPVGSYSFSASGLPPGLTLATNGSLTGIPTATGTFTVNVSVTDTVYLLAGGTTVTKSLSLTVASPVTVTTSSLAAGTFGTSYTAPLAASGGTAPYSFTATGLPTGLAVSGASIAGTPTQAGTFTVGITAADSTAGTPLVSPAVNLQLTIAQATQTIAFTSTPPASAAPGSTYAVTATGGASGNPVTFSIDAASTSGACTISGATVSFAAPGTCIVNADQAGNTNYLAATRAQQSITVGYPTPVFSTTAPFVPFFGPTSGGTSVTINGSGFTGVTGVTIGGVPATNVVVVNDTKITMTTGVGPSTGGKLDVVVSNPSRSATWPGGFVYVPTVTVTTSALPNGVAGANYTAPALTASGGVTPYTFAATGLPSGLTINPSSGVISGIPTVAGSFTVQATATDSTIAFIGGPYTSVQRALSLEIGVGSQVITFTSTAPSPASAGSTYAVTATGGASGLPVVFSIDGASTSGACTIAGGTVSFTGAGSCIINANQAGNASYTAASQVQQTVTVVKKAQTISFTKPADQTFGAGPVALVATATSGLVVTFGSTTTGVCTVSGTTATIVGAGTCSITASQAGDATWLAATAVEQTFNIGKAAQTISFNKPADIVFAAGASVPLTATATSGLAVTFTSLTTSVCTVSGATATMVAAGACSVRASQAGNANYAAAPDVTQTFNAIGQPKITATATVSPPSFSRPGETLLFVITLSNTGGVAATGVKLVEPRLTGITCAATTVAAGGELRCQGTTLTTTADLAAGKISINPQLTYTYGGAQP